MDYRSSELLSELTDLVIRISALESSSFHEAFLLFKALRMLNSASDFLFKYQLEHES